MPDNVALTAAVERLEQPPVRRTVCYPKDSLPPAGRKTCLQVAFLIGLPVKSAFALLSQKVTKEWLRPDTSRTINVREGSMIMRRIRRSLPDREKGKFIEADNQRYDRERLCQP